MSDSRHPYVSELGSTVGVGTLIRPDARAMARYVESGLDPDVQLVECRRRNDGAETVVLNIRVYPPQHPVAEIHRREEMAVLLVGEDRHPVVFALRASFPETPHQNRVSGNLPRYPCLDDRPWDEVAAEWTPYSYVERLKWWLNAAASGELSGDAQFIDPLFMPTGLDLLIPASFVSEWDASRTYGLVPSEDVPDSEVKCLHLIEVRAELETDPRCIRTVLVSLPPRDAGVMVRVPENLGQLCELLAEMGCDLARILSVWSTSSDPATRRMRPAIIVVSEILRPGEENVVKRDLSAFAFQHHICLGDLGEALGVLYPHPDSVKLRIWGCTLSSVEADQKRLADLQLMPMATQVEFSPEVAREASGVCETSRPEFLLVGAGAVGSHVAMTLTREGRYSWTVVDDDWLRPHNLARHVLGPGQVGAMKAQALANALADLSRGAARYIVANILRPYHKVAEIRDAASRASCILDCSASVAAARRLSDMDLGTCRRISVFFNPFGTAVVVLAEDAVRGVQLDALEAQYYRLLIRTSALAGHLATPPGGYRYAGACRTVSARIPESRAAILSGLAAQAIPEAVASDTGTIWVWSLSAEGAVVMSSAVAASVTRHAVGEWSVVFDAALAGEILSLRMSALPSETGGVLVGIVDHARKVITVVDALPPPPDSKGSSRAFVRGTEGLVAELADVAVRTGGMVRYIGEWHTHPRWHRASPSSTDVCQLQFLRDELRREALPATMVIAGSNGVSVIQLADTSVTAAAASEGADVENRRG